MRESMPICLARRCLWTDKTDPTSVGLVLSQFTNFIRPKLSLISSFVLVFVPPLFYAHLYLISLHLSTPTPLYCVHLYLISIYALLAIWTMSFVTFLLFRSPFSMLHFCTCLASFWAEQLTKLFSVYQTLIVVPISSYLPFSVGLFLYLPP